jgi:ribosomal protein L16 Arg81 hydroxylase
MKIVDIFAERLYSFVYKSDDGLNYQINEFDRLIELWTDVNYLRDFAKQNQVEDINGFVRDKLRQVEKVQDLFEEISISEKSLASFFTPYRDTEMGFVLLSLQKGLVKKYQGLRLYAIKIDDECFVITSGAIKMSQTAQGHYDTINATRRLENAKKFLVANGVIDNDSFHEFKIEL